MQRRARERVHSTSETERTLQDEYMFDLVHSAHEEGCRPEGAAIATHTNPFSARREQEGMISPSKRITATSLEQRALRSDAEDLVGGGIRDTGHQIDSGSSTPLIEDLEKGQIFKDKAKEEGASVTDLVLSVSRLLRKDLQAVVDSMEPVKPWDEG